MVDDVGGYGTEQQSTQTVRSARSDDKQIRVLGGGEQHRGSGSFPHLPVDLDACDIDRGQRPVLDPFGDAYRRVPALRRAARR